MSLSWLWGAASNICLIWHDEWVYPCKIVPLTFNVTLYHNMTCLKRSLYLILKKHFYGAKKILLLSLCD